MIVRSNGVVTYVGKDIANQFWKFGLLGRDFRYRLFATQADGRAAVGDDVGRRASRRAPAFGRAAAHLQRHRLAADVPAGAAQPGAADARPPDGSGELDSFLVRDGGAVARDGARARLRDGADGEDAQKPFVEVSGRKGLGVKIDDLLDLLIDKAAAEVAKRNPEFTAEECRRAGAQIAVAAIRYFMLKFSRGKLIVFDIEEALSFEGETGPYLQYAVVRAEQHLPQAAGTRRVSEADVLAGARSPRGRRDCRADELESLDCWAVVFEASRLDDVVEQVVRSLEFSVLAKYAFGLAQMFNAFYHRYPILNEERRGPEALARRRVSPTSARSSRARWT